MSKLTIPTPQVLLKDASDILFADPEDTFTEESEWTLDAQIAYAEHALIDAQQHLNELKAKKAALEIEALEVQADAHDADFYADCQPGDAVAQALNANEVKILKEAPKC